MADRSRTVTFKDSPKVYNIPKYDPTRVKYWEYFVVDRWRFQIRIKKFEKLFVQTVSHKHN